MNWWLRGTELDRFRAFLEREGQIASTGGDAWRNEQSRRERDVAQGLADWTDGIKPEVVTVEQFVKVVCPDHEGWGYQRGDVDSWVRAFRQHEEHQLADRSWLARRLWPNG